MALLSKRIFYYIFKLVQISCFIHSKLVGDNKNFKAIFKHCAKNLMTSMLFCTCDKNVVQLGGRSIWLFCLKSSTICGKHSDDHAAYLTPWITDLQELMLS
jgi:hypothetical protein